MASYFFIQSLDAFSDTRVGAQFRLMTSLADRKNSVQVLLVQNAVLMARQGVACEGLDELVRRNIPVLVDDFSLAQREISATDLRKDVKTAEITCVADAMLDHHKVIWN